MTKVATVYRFVDAAGEPIYVGCSVSVLVRLANHAGTRPWWADVAQITLEHFDSVDDALAREAELIAAECPRENVRGLPSGVARARRRAFRESDEYRQRHMYRVPGGLTCGNCGWEGQWIRRGLRVDEVPCPTCGLADLCAGEGQAAVSS